MGASLGLEIPARRTRLRELLKVYVIADRTAARGRGELEVARAALAGGARVVQLRAKERPARELCELAAALTALCAEYGALAVVNDRLDVALAAGAHGVHLGQDDLPAAAARRLAGPELVLGVSAATPAEARAAEAAGADYLGVGSVYPTATKPDAGLPIGLLGLAQVVAATSLPVVAIGGIRPENAAAVVSQGAAGVAVVSSVVGAEDVAAATRALLAVVEGALRRDAQGAGR